MLPVCTTNTKQALARSLLDFDVVHKSQHPQLEASMPSIYRASPAKRPKSG